MSITLSKKHGVNPSLICCPVCGKEYAITLFGRIKGDAEAPKSVQGDLCDECKTKHITIVEVKKSDNGYKPTGRQMYIPKENCKKECPNNIALMIDSEFEELIKQ